MRLLAGLALLGVVSAASPGPTPTTPAQIAAASAQAAAAKKNEALNEDFQNYIMVVCGSVAAGMIIWRVGIELIKYIRTVTSLNNDTQRYFALPRAVYGKFKKHMLYAPLFRKRHNREFQLSAAINVGTLPTRFQFLFLLGYLGTNVAFCVLSINWCGDFSQTSRAFRNRTGVLATVNMVCF
jgi:hypothetical protein